MRKYIPLLLIMFLSCETVIQPDLPDDSDKLVVYSFFRPDQTVQFDVFSAVSIYEPSAMIRATGLTIDLFENDQLIETITENASGAYIGATLAKSNVMYRFEITTVEGTLVSRSTVPEAINIESARFSSEVQDVNLGEYGYPASLTFADPGDEENFYALEVFVDNCVNDCTENGISGDLNELLVEDIKINTSGNTNITIGLGPEGIDGLRYIYLSDNGFNGEAFTLDFYIIPTLIDPENQSNGVIKYVLKSISKDYYQYLLTSDYQRRIEDEGTLAEPVQIYSNIANGLGLFAGYNISVYTIALGG